MKIDISNKNYSIIIAGILILSIASIFMATALGFGGYKTNKNNTIDNSIKEPICTENYFLNCQNGTKDNVLVSQRRDWTCVDTVPGDITITKYNIPTQLPLCITDNKVKNWYVTVKSCGGYYPINEGSYVTLYQEKDNVVNGGKIWIKWTKIEDPTLCCCCTIWNGTFDVEPNCIHLDSNHFPNTLPSPWWYEQNDPCAKNLNKWVDVQLFSNWSGCHKHDQSFEIILTHKNEVPRIPNSQ